MKHRKFKVGQRVEVIEGYKKGTKGKVCNILYDDSCGVGVDFGKHINGHTCGGYCKDGNGYYYYDKNLKIINKYKEPISIIIWNADFCEVYNKKEEKDRIKELINDKDVNNNSIRIYY